jgi:hypothetical protein
MATRPARIDDPAMVNNYADYKSRLRLRSRIDEFPRLSRIRAGRKTAIRAGENVRRIFGIKSDAERRGLPK